jgi:hypothetical protein
MTKFNWKTAAGMSGAISLFILAFVTGEGAIAPRGGFSSNASAEERGACSVQTLKGEFGVKFEGTRLPDQHYISISLMRFDGRGTFTVSELGRFEGQPVNRTFTGPYTVNSDCSGFVDYSSNLTNPPHQAHGAFIIVDHGNELFFLDDEDGWAAGGIGKRL